MEKLKIPRSDIPAVTHVDYSARLQTVSAADNPRYHGLISHFKKKTGYGVVINTSFNVRGEPIVCTPEDAYLCFMRTEMDILALGNCLLKKDEQIPFEQQEERVSKKLKNDDVKSEPELRKFGLIMTVAFAVLSAVLYFRNSVFMPCAAGLSGFFLLSALLSPKLLFHIEKFWMKLASVMGYIMTRVLLTLVYLLAVIPTGFVMRLLGKKPLQLDFARKMKTYWVDVDPEGPCSRPEKQY